MASSNRTAVLSRILKILKKHYKPVTSLGTDVVTKDLLFACCLENSPAGAAEKVFDYLQKHYFDWNEVRVTSIRELMEGMKPLADAEQAARRLRGVLQSMFESIYSFDLEELRKQSIGHAIKKLESLEGTTPFVTSFVVQHSLGGHSIPVNRGALTGLYIVGAISESESNQYRVPGLERTISKNKGKEAGSLLHQWGVDIFANPYAPAVRKLLLEIDPDCRDRLPKRRPAKPKTATEAAAPKKSVPAAAKNASGKKKARPTPAKKKKAKDAKKIAKAAKGKKRGVAKKAAKPRPKKTKSGKSGSVKRLSKRKPR